MPSRTTCPNSTASGCRCPEHALGLMAYARDMQAYAAALEPSQPTRLRVVTMPADDERPNCRGTMTCPCEACELDRQRSKVIQQAARPRQPWEARPSRDRAA